MTIGKFKPFGKRNVGHGLFQTSLTFLLPLSFPTGDKIGGVTCIYVADLIESNVKSALLPCQVIIS